MSSYRLLSARLLCLWVGLFWVMAGWAANAPVSGSLLLRFQEGVHYQRVPNVATAPVAAAGKVKVIEFFSYGCPHCFAVESYVTQWRAHKPANIDFDTMPAYWNDYFRVMAQTYYTLVALKQEKLHDKIFNAIHGQGRSLQTPEQVEDFLVEQGLDRKKVHATFNSFGVMQNMKKADTIFRGYGLTGVPTFVVGGQYMTNVGMAGSPENTFKVVEFLVQKVKNKQ